MKKQPAGIVNPFISKMGGHKQEKSQSHNTSQDLQAAAMHPI